VAAVYEHLHKSQISTPLQKQITSIEAMTSMNVHYLQHVPFEGLGSMERWLQNHGHHITSTQLYNKESLPNLDDVDWLIVMGGPMGVEDQAIYPWMSAEKAFIKQAIDQKKIVLGICLGAQLIADVLDAYIIKNTYREIGWFPVQLSKEAKTTLLGAALPDKFDAFHWHGDTFAIPENATPLAYSEACLNQGFIINNRVVGLQFHLETTTESALDLTIHCKNELNHSRYVQTAEMILADPERFTQINIIMDIVLNCLEKEKPS
jgi:GMP synthase (glutamine-hydrolysing)